MTLARADAWELLCEWTKTEALRTHARAVETVMRAAAARYGEPGADPEVWGAAGLLHDADYEQWPETHPAKIVAWLRERGEPAIAQAIAGHYTKWDAPRDAPLDRALLACDELTGFIGACCRVRPDGIASLTAASVLKKLQTHNFAAKVERAEVSAGAALLAVPLADHVDFVIAALRPHAADLALLPPRPPA